MWQFKERIEKKYNVKLDTYHDLHTWSIENVAEFWAESSEFTGVYDPDFTDGIEGKVNRDSFCSHDTRFFPWLSPPEAPPLPSNTWELGYFNIWIPSRKPAGLQSVQDEPPSITYSQSEVEVKERGIYWGKCL